MDTTIADIIQENWLRYMTDSKPGITRKKHGKKWWYFDAQGSKIADEKTITRIDKLVLPPAWTKVRICPIHNGHIQATGIDSKGRKQYRYHADRIAARKQNKFSRMKDFGHAMPKLRDQIQQDLADKHLSQNKVLAAAIMIMDKTGIRVGNNIYKQLYWSFGLTTLRNRHANIQGSTIQFQFIGKKWIKHKISLKSKKLARIIQQCKELAWHDLFEYIDEYGQIKTINSENINNYIKTITGYDFTAKDFRTRHGTIYAISIIYRQLTFEEKASLIQVIDAVAEELGNTRAVVKKHYIHPIVLERYDDEKFIQDLKKFCTIQDDTTYEKFMCSILDTL